MHDVCRMVINAAVTIAGSARGRRLGNLEFSLVDQTAEHETHPDGICRLLAEAALARKLAVAKGYAELAGEVQAKLERGSSAAFRVECLRPVSPRTDDSTGDQVPFYESYGEKQVAAGHYRQILRYREHIAPLAETLGRLKHT